MFLLYTCKLNTGILIQEQNEITFRFMQNKDLPDDVQLESMLMKLTTNEHPNPQDDVQLHVHPDTAGQHVSNSLELDEETTCKEQNEFDSTIKSDHDGESPTTISEPKEANKACKGFPDVIPTWERRRLPFCPLYVQTQTEDEELRMEEPTEEKESLPVHLPTSSGTDAALGYADAVSKLTRQKPVNVTSKTGRSVSDPEGPHLIQNPKEPRRLSAPSVSTSNEFEDVAKGQKGSSAEIFREHEMSNAQTRGMRNHVKIFTQKFVRMLKEKPNRVHTDSKSSQDSVEEEPQSVCIAYFVLFITS